MQDSLNLRPVVSRLQTNVLITQEKEDRRQVDVSRPEVEINYIKRFN
jgi:hypothetical protein